MAPFSIKEEAKVVQGLCLEIGQFSSEAEWEEITNRRSRKNNTLAGSANFSCSVAKINLLK